jgi:hypothetical protein
LTVTIANDSDPGRRINPFPAAAAIPVRVFNIIGT